MAMTALCRQARARWRAIATRGVLIVACGLLAAACGSVAAPSGTTPGTGSSGSTSSAGTTTSPTSSPSPVGTAAANSSAKVSLSVTLSGANTTGQKWTLQCDPPGGTAPNPTLACAKLANGQSIMTTKPVRLMCPMILADARIYTITGVYYGKAVHLTIVDGNCDLSRWSMLNQLFN